MKYLFRNPLLVIFLLIGIVYYYVGPNTAMLMFCLACQAITVIGLVKYARIILKTRNGVFVYGEAIESTEVKNNNGDKEYNVIVEFSGPNSEQRYRVEYRTDKLPLEPYKLWFDKSNPSASIVVTDRPRLLRFAIIAFVFTLFLCYVDYLYLVKIWGEKSL